MKNYTLDILALLFFLLGTIAGVSLDRMAVKLETHEPKQTKCRIVQNRNTHLFDCEVFNDYAVIK
jgi:hypothetical protein